MTDAKVLSAIMVLTSSFSLVVVGKVTCPQQVGSQGFLQFVKLIVLQCFFKVLPLFFLVSLNQLYIREHFLLNLCIHLLLKKNSQSMVKLLRDSWLIQDFER
jgi:hypothetical protein